MSVHNKKPPGHIHKIREFELEKIILSDEFDILQIVGEGWFGKILLVEHRATDTEMVLKALPKPYVSLRDFYREFHFGLHLGVHRNIVTTYDVAFETAGFYVFTQEYAPLGDLTSNVADSGIGELHSKKVAKQIASALDYMHSKEIVHRDVKLDNVLIYKSDFSRVKLCDFGESYKTGSVVERRNEWLPYSPPEVLQIQPEGTYEALPSHDVWQFAIVIFVCLTGCLPWQKASTDDPRYARYLAWQNINMMIPLRRTPKLFKLLTTKASRMFRKFLEPRPDRRPKNLQELNRFLDDRWLAKGSEKDMAEFEPDELCPSMYSFHSSPEEKNRVLWSLAEQGIETTVDRREKKNRIKNWIESSVIMEDEEEEDSGSASASPSSSVSREPVPGHISSVRAENEAEKQRQKTINTTIKDASQKHFDPRTGQLQQGPSEMGTIFRNQSLDNLSNATTTGNQSLNSSLLTLGSRNNLIMSEGNPYQLDLNIDDGNQNQYDDESFRIQKQPQQQQQQKKTVNEHLKQFASFNYNNNSNINYNNYSNNASNTASLLSVANNNDKYNFNSNNNKTNLYHTLSDPNITDIQDIDSSINITNQKNMNDIFQTKQKSRTPKPLQRTKSDSLRKVLNFKNQKFATTTTKTQTTMTVDIDIDSSSNTNNNNNKTIHNQQQKQQQFISASATTTNNNPKNNPNINVSSNNVSKFGLMSAFKSIATISVPEYNQENNISNNSNNNHSNNNTINKTEVQQFQNNKKSDNKYTTLDNINKNTNLNKQNINYNNNNGNVKDSGYGSYDKVNITTTTTTTTATNNNNNNINNKMLIDKYPFNKNHHMMNETIKTQQHKNDNYQIKKFQKNETIGSENKLTVNTVTQTSQTQTTQYGARKKNYNETFPPTSSMKDTAYDRIKFSNNNSNNYNARK